MAIRRELAAASPDRWRPGLALWSSELGRSAEALAAEKEAAVIQRGLAATRPDLDGSLHDLAAMSRRWDCKYKTV